MLTYQKCYNIQIDGSGFRGWSTGAFQVTTAASAMSASIYEASVLAQLERIIAFWSGWALLRAIYDAGQAKGKYIRIVPWSDADAAKHGKENAYAHSLSGKGAAPASVQPFLGNEDDPKTTRDERYEVATFRGTGTGSDVEVHYTPNATLPACPPRTSTPVGCRPTWLGVDLMSPDDLLVHELVHALRMLRGQSDCIPTRQEDYDNEEEFFAVLVANIYVSEKGNATALRANHHGGGVLRQELNTNETFLGKGERWPSWGQREDRALVAKFVRENNDVCGKIRLSRAAFNPIREYMDNTADYPPV